VPDGHDIAAPDEEVRLAEGDAAVHELRGSRDDEERLAILLEFWTLMRLLGVLDRHLMQIELPLDAAQELGRRLVEADPDDVTRPLRPLARFLDRGVADALAAGIDARRDDSGLILARRGRGIRHDAQVLLRHIGTSRRWSKRSQYRPHLRSRP
jgi:hypothetical protein